nr:hypothetical protein [Aquihabitans sp. G128]
MENTTAALSGSVPPSAVIRSARTRCSCGLTATHLRCGSRRLSVTVAFCTYGSCDRLRVRPQTSVLPTATLAGARVSWASMTAPATWSTRNDVHAGSKPARLEAWWL